MAFAGARSRQTDEQQGGDYAPTVLNGMDYGEWCEPGITPMQAMMNLGAQERRYGVYLAHSPGRLLAEAAEDWARRTMPPTTAAPPPTR